MMGTRLERWLWENPALRREWLSRLHRASRRSRWGEIAAWAGLVVLMALYLAVMHWLARPERPPSEARALLLGLALFHLLLTALLLPGPTAGSISTERERETWRDLLLTTLRPSQLVAARFLGALWPGLVWTALLLPLLFAAAHVSALGGLQFLLLALVLVLTQAAVVAFSLWLSGRSRSTRNAMMAAYAVVAVHFGGTLAWFEPWLVRGENLWWYASPAWHAAVLCLGKPTLSPLARPLLPEWAWFSLYCLGVMALGLWLLTRRVASVERR